jgi:2-dehydro-3-deoxygluconokinase
MTFKKVITLGEVMLRLSTPGFARFTQSGNFLVTYAGAEANVAVSLRRFGIPSAHVTRFPDNDLGKAAAETLQRHGVDCSEISFGGERLGVYFLENGADQRSSRVIYDRFNSAFADIRRGDINWKEVFKDAQWFHYTGITPAISQGAADVCLEAVQVANQLGLKVSGDINYRRNLWQYGKTARDVMPALIEQTHVMNAGLADLENCAGIKMSSFAEGCDQAFRQFSKLEYIASNERESVSSSHNNITGMLCARNKKVITSEKYEIRNIVDRVGTGDAFMAGLVYGMITKKDDEQVLAFATAACALKHTIEGDVNLVSVEEVEQLVKGENVGKLLR